jgi:hypothetical protein
MTTDDRFVKRDRMRYTKNSLSSSLALLAIVFNVLYFVSIYQSDKGKFYYTILIGASVLYNLVFMLMAFLSSEGVKNYKPGYSWLLLALGVGQVARIFILPQQAHEAVVQNAPVMGDAQYTYVLVCLIASAACCIVSAVINLIKSRQLAEHIASIEKQAA